LYIALLWLKIKTTIENTNKTQGNFMAINQKYHVGCFSGFIIYLA